jgi:hypothetical protein
VKPEDTANRKKIHRWIMLFCGAFMSASGIAAAYLAFSTHGGFPSLLYVIFRIWPSFRARRKSNGEPGRRKRSRRR